MQRTYERTGLLSSGTFTIQLYGSHSISAPPPEHVQPALPWDVERILFETAARADRYTALQLVRVAKRTQAWIEPIIYAVIDFEPFQPHRLSEFARTIATRPRSFFVQNVKALSFHGQRPSSEFVKILETCTGIIALAIWTTAFTVDLQRFSPKILALMGALQPTHLSIDVTPMSAGNQATAALLLPMLESVTHLDVYGLPSVQLIPHLRRVTQVSFSVGYATAVSNPSTFFRDIISRPSLREMVGFSHQPFASSSRAMRQAIVDILHLPDDPRLSVIITSSRLKHWKEMVLAAVEVSTL